MTTQLWGELKKMLERLINADVGGEAPPSYYHLLEKAKELLMKVENRK